MSRSSVLARVGGPAVVVLALAPAAVHARQLTLAVGLEQAVVGGVVPLAVSLAVAAYGVVLIRRDDDVGGVAAAGGIVAGTLLTAAVASWVARGGVVTYSSMARPTVVAAHVLTAGLAIGGVLGVLAERVRRTERVTESLFDGLSNPVARVVREDEGRRVVEVNEAFRQTFGPERPHVGSPLSACLRPADGEGSVDEVLEAEVAARSHLACGVAGGGDGVREFRVSRVPVDDPEEFVVLADVTEQRRRERRLSVLNRVLRHDLRTAVNVIDGQAAALATRLDEATPELDAVDRQTDGLLRLSKRARQLEALVAGETGDTETDLTALARDRVATFRGRDYDVTVETALPASPVVVDGNELLGAAVDELLDNVAHHAGPAATARVELAREGAMATLTVADDGPGLPETETAVVDRTTESDLDHASGIGLWFVTWVLVELGGEVTVDGDDGTTIELHVPLATDNRDSTVDDRELATSSAGSSGDTETDDAAGVESNTVTDGGEVVSDDEGRTGR